MSKSVGKQTSKALVWLLLLFLIVGLGGFGVSNFGGTIDSIGAVGDEKISTDTYGRALRQELAAQEAETGQAVTLAQAQASGLVDAVRARVIADAALDNEMRRLGVSVGDGRVAEDVMNVAAFKGPDGEFNRDTYRFVLEQNGLTESGFETQIRDEAARSLLQAGVVAGLSPPQAYADTIYGFLAERRSASMIALAAGDLDAPLPDPGEADLTAQYEATPAAYTAPRTRKITYAWLTPDMMLDQIEPDEEMMRQLYQERIDQYVQPERRLVERLVFATEDEAATVRAEIDAGQTTFDAAVEARGLSLADADMGDVAEVDIGGDAGAAVFALEGPGIAGPAMSDLGPALFRVNAILPAQEITFDEARDDLAVEAARDRAVRAIADRMADLDDELAAGATLEDLARDTEMDLGQIDYVPDSEDGIAAYQSFRDAADAVAEGDFPELVELEDGGVFALRLDQEVAPALRPLGEVRDQVTRDWRAAETLRRLAEKAEGLKARVEGGEGLDALGVPVDTQEGLSRGGLTPPALAQALFEMKAPGEMRIVSGADTVWLIRLDAVLPPAENDPAAEALQGSIAGQAAQGMAQDLYTYFAQALVNAAGLSLDQAAINAVHAQFR